MYSQVQEGAVESAAADEAAAPIPPSVVAARVGAAGKQEVASAEPRRADEAPSAAARRPTALSSLKAEIARAMQDAADRERERIDAGVGAEEAAQVEKIVARAAAEAAQLSKHADEDVSRANAWYKDQVKRIREEADRQIDDRRTRLEQSLTHHGSLIETEIESVHVAVQAYRASLDAFFGRLAEEHDPSAIARLAGDLPDPPDLDEVRAEARSRAMQALEQESAEETPEPPDANSPNGTGVPGPERELVPVMDPGTVEQVADALTAAAPMATLVPSAAAASEASASPSASEAEAAATSPEAVSVQGNVAVRVIRALTLWASPTGESGDQSDG